MAPTKQTVQEELEQLQLEETRYRVAELRGQKEMRRIRRDSIEASVRAEEERNAFVQSHCLHRKGGMGKENFFRGNDANYAVVKHQMPTGEIHVFCQRCSKHWAPPQKPGLRATPEQRDAYNAAMREYQTAVDYPTDNTMSGSQLFVVIRDGVPSNPLYATAT